MQFIQQLCKPPHKILVVPCLFSRYVVSNGYICLHKQTHFVDRQALLLHRHYGQAGACFRRKLLPFDIGEPAAKRIDFPKKMC